MKRIPALLLALALLLAILPASAEGNAMKFDKSVNRVFEGETLQTVLTLEGDPAGGELTYESSNPKVATVDGQGVVTGVSKGEAVITASSKTEKKTFRTQLNVTVARKASSVEVNTEKLPVYDAADEKVAGLLAPDESGLPVLVLPVKKSYTLRIAVLPKDASSRRVTLESSDPEIFRVRGRDTVTGVAPGEAVLTVANELSPEVRTQFRVLVIQPVTRVSLSLPAKTVAAGEQISVAAEVLPADASVPGLVWSSADESIATVDANGVVTGIARGNARIVAAATDGSNVRASVSVRVVQKAEQVTLDKTEVTVDVGRTAVLKASVLPKNTDDKKVVWSSSDESVATVSSQGRVTGKALGECEIICASAVNGEAVARATVHVQQPVKKVAFDGEISVYAGEEGRLSWTVSPADASDPSVTLSVGKPSVLAVDQDGTVRGLAAGETYVKAVANDGSNSWARVKVRVLQHVTGVHMKRHTAYIDVRETASVSAVLEPENASNKNLTWTVDDPAIAKVKGKGSRVSITGVSKGTTRVVGVTEDGGLETSIAVNIGDWDKALKLLGFDWDEKGRFAIRVRNNSDVTVTRITAEIWMFDASPDADNAPIPINQKDKSHVVKAVWKKALAPGEETTLKAPWQMVDYVAPADMDITRGTVFLVSYQVEDDWIKTIREKHRPFLDW